MWLEDWHCLIEVECKFRPNIEAIGKWIRIFEVRLITHEELRVDEEYATPLGQSDDVAEKLVSWSDPLG